MSLRLLSKYCLLALLLIASACGSKKVYYLTDQRFPSASEDAEIKLYVNEVERPHIKIAHIQSFADSLRDTEVKREQLKDLQIRARDVGADAVVNVRMMSNQMRGFVVDEKVPFRAYRQGRYEHFFLRGTAVRFIEEGEEDRSNPAQDLSAMPSGVPEEGGIPTIVTTDPDDDLPMEPVPAGLAPRIP